MEVLPRLPHPPGKIKAPSLKQGIELIRQKAFSLLQKIKTIGLSETMDDYEKRKLGIFNQINFLQLLTGFIIPMLGFLRSDGISFKIWLTACLPAVTSIVILYFNHLRKHETALLSYFILYPFLTCIVY